MKYKYFVVGDFGQDKQVDRKTFLYYCKGFGRFLFDKTGHFTTNIHYNDIENAYNPQGILIAWRQSND